MEEEEGGSVRRREQPGQRRFVEAEEEGVGWVGSLGRYGEVYDVEEV